jgi:Flp pilus assembly protein TadB
MNSRFPADAANAEQQSSQRAAVAVALAPVLVLLSLTLVIGDLIGADVGFAAVAAAVVWLVYEMHQYQRHIEPQEELPAPALDVLADRG